VQRCGILSSDGKCFVVFVFVFEGMGTGRAGRIVASAVVFGYSSVRMSGSLCVGWVMC
jgi:hypothetical protein